MTDKIKTRGAYTGRRITTENKLVFAWLVGETEMLFKKQLVSYAQIGEQFELTTNADASSVFTGGDAKPVPVEGLHVERHGWIAKDAAAQASLDAIRARKKLEARPTELENAIRPLREMLARVHTHRDRAALIAHITAELWRKESP